MTLFLLKIINFLSENSNILRENLNKPKIEFLINAIKHIRKRNKLNFLNYYD